MSIKWRLGVMALQFAVLLLITWLATGRAIANEAWFVAGLLTVAVNPTLLEPFFPRQKDVIGNSIAFLFIYLFANKGASAIGWHAAMATFAVAGLLAIYGVVAGQRPRDSNKFDLPRVARSLAQLASSQVIYSTVFFLDLVDYAPIASRVFWVLTGGWATVSMLAAINWQRLWSMSSAGPVRCTVEALVGPAIVTLSAPSLPAQGSWVEVRSRTTTADGLVIRRIVRRDDVWGQIHITNPDLCQKLVVDVELECSVKAMASAAYVGSVDAGSSDTELRFIATQPLSTGHVVAVPLAGQTEILYQLVGAAIEFTDIKGGAHLFERAKAAQLGVYHPAEFCFRRHNWTPTPGAPVLRQPSPQEQQSVGALPSSFEIVGHVIGTQLPVYMDLDAAATGHVIVLGMTKMGKSTFADRLARKIAQTRCVTLLDLTGEYVTKKGLPRLDRTKDMNVPGISVFEPKKGEIPADRALECLEWLLEKAIPEYQSGVPFPRTIIIDEAHQFIPEPAGLGFNAPGRDSSFKIGLLLMQIRKYGISVILISQRTAVVAKSALSQCENVIAFRSVDQTGLDYLEALTGGDIRPMLPKLKQGEALVFGPAISAELPVAVKVLQAEASGVEVHQ